MHLYHKMGQILSRALGFDNELPSTGHDDRVSTNHSLVNVVVVEKNHVGGHVNHNGPSLPPQRVKSTPNLNYLASNILQSLQIM